MNCCSSTFKDLKLSSQEALNQSYCDKGAPGNINISFHLPPPGLSNVTFRVESNIFHYRSNGMIQRSLRTISLSIRTRQSAATLLHAQKDSDYLTVSLLDSHPVVELQVGADRVRLQTQGLVSDGEWHTVELSMENQTLLTSRWIMAVDGGQEEPSLSKTPAGGLDFLREGADIFLGGPSPDAAVKFSGCLGTVEIGGLPLPFHHDTEMTLPRPQEERFARINSNAGLQFGCWGASVCARNPCENQGVCEDLFDLHRCKCTSEWTGPTCQESTNPCISSPCIYGTCTNLPEGFKCVCEPGYSGEQCEAEVDMCENSNCGNGATCLKGSESYSCLCPQNLTGQYCE